MSNNDKVITDIKTLEKIMGHKKGWLSNLLVPFLIANLAGLFGIAGFFIKNYYVFQSTVATVEKIQIIQNIQSDKIQQLEIKQATVETKVISLENRKHGN